MSCYAEIATNIELNPTYLAGSGTYTIVNDTLGASVNGDGVVTVPIGSLPIGVYTVTVKYLVGEIEYYTTVSFTIEDCEDTLLETDFSFCEDSGSFNQQIQFESGILYDDWSIDTPPAGITISATGLLSINTATASTTVVNLIYDTDKEVSITINIIECPEPTQSEYIECENDVLGIVWINQEGGRQSYYFNQIKDFGIKQKDGDTFINSTKETRYYTRGKVDNTVSIQQEYIPIEHITSISSLKNSIQSWFTNDITDAAVYKAIIINESTWNVRRTNDRFYSISFDFSYAISKTIQRQ